MKLKYWIIGMSFLLFSFTLTAKLLKSQNKEEGNIIAESALDTSIVPEFSFVMSDKPMSKYYVQSRNRKSVPKSKLISAKSLAGFVADYPSTWIADYYSVMVFTTSNGRQRRALSLSDKLTIKQREILTTADMSSRIVVNVKHKTLNSVTKEVEDKEMIIELEVGPEVTAKFENGIKGLQDYLYQESREDVVKMGMEDGFVAIVYFTINEEGKAEAIEISEAENYKGVNKILMKAINSMPVWTPALDMDGNRVKQRFEFMFGYGIESGC